MSMIINEGSGTVEKKEVVEEANGEKQGVVKFEYSNGDIFIGNGFFLGKTADSTFYYHGKGVFESPSRTYRYDGEYSLGLRNGTGKLFYKGYLMYEGEFRKGMKDGEGKFMSIAEDGYVVYEGDVECGQYHGFGRLYHYADCLEYEGEFRNGHPHGKGTMYDPDNRYYSKGTYQFGILSGESIIVSNDFEYKGGVCDGLFHGIGELKKTENQSERYTYNGSFCCGLFHGSGELTRMKEEEETVWKGIFRNGGMNGDFMVTYSSGSSCSEHVEEVHNDTFSKRRKFKFPGSSNVLDEMHYIPAKKKIKLEDKLKKRLEKKKSVAKNKNVPGGKTLIKID